MDELVQRLVSDVGIDRGTAEKAVGIILEFLRKEGPADEVETLIAGLPGSDRALAAAASAPASFGMGGIMGVGSRLMSIGLDMGQLQAVTRILIGYGREKAGEDTVGRIVDAIPGLGQFV